MAYLLKSLLLLSLFFSYAAAAGHGHGKKPAKGNVHKTPKKAKAKPIGNPHAAVHGNKGPKPKPVKQAQPAVAVGNQIKAVPIVPNKGAAAGPEKGMWKLDNPRVPVSAMHIQLMPNNKIIWYDTASNGLSDSINEPRFCKPRMGGRADDPAMDCTSHGVEYDVETANFRLLKLTTSPWCSSGGLNKKGELVSTGGDKDGFKSVRILRQNSDTFEENPRALFSNRWYATHIALEDGRFILVGGRNSLNYEIIPNDPAIRFTPKQTELPLLDQTTDDGGRENNLYPFVNLLPDGNLFVFANYKSIILNPSTGETIRTLPDFTNARNYPPSAGSALLPIDLNNFQDEDYTEIPVEVLICGGNTREAYRLSDLQRPRVYLPALKDCGRLIINKEGAKWDMEEMPSPRVMGDMLLLPTGDVLLINGAQMGTSAWNGADKPNFTPILYSSNKPKGQRFQELASSEIPRMYHSSSAVLPDGRILVAGSNTNAYYMRPEYNKPGDDFTYPTELRVEKFSPPYLNPALAKFHVEILEVLSDKEWKYGGDFNLNIKATGVVTEDLKVTMYAPPFTTHGYSHNQRLLILKIKEVAEGRITVVAPPSGKLAPPGYYLVFVVHNGVPSRGMWVHIDI